MNIFFIFLTTWSSGNGEVKRRFQEGRYRHGGFLHGVWMIAPMILKGMAHENPAASSAPTGREMTA
jgi:hypothetical protein